MKGKVKWFHPIKGYGFIQTEKEDLFFHISEFEDYKKMKVKIGEELEFEISKSEKGNKAIKIKKTKKEA